MPEDGEINVEISIRREALERLGLEYSDAEAMVMGAVSGYLERLASSTPQDDLPALEEIPIQLDGKVYAFGDLARVSYTTNRHESN